MAQRDHEPGSPRGFKVEVTKKIIDHAKKESSSHCMVADAIRHIAGASSINVTQDYARFNWWGYRYTFRLPAKIALLVKDFDAGAAIPPFAFLLRKDQGFPPVPMRVRTAPTGARVAKNQKRAAPEVTRTKRRYHGIQVLKRAGSDGE